MTVSNDLVKLRWLIWRDLITIARTRAFWMAAVVDILVVAAFLVLWGEGVPVIDGSVFEQTLLVQAAALGVLLPWTAARCGAIDELRDLVLLAHDTATAPSRVIVARSAALFAALAALVVLPMPLLIVAQQISAVELSGLVLVLPFFALCAFVAVITIALTLTPAGRLTRWLMATFMTFIAMRLLPGGPIAIMVLATVALAGLLGLASRADSTLRFLPDDDA